MKSEHKLLVNLSDHDRANLAAVMDRWHLPTMASAIRFALALVSQRGEHPSPPIAGEIGSNCAGGAHDPRRSPSGPAQADADCVERTASDGRVFTGLRDQEETC